MKTQKTQMEQTTLTLIILVDDNKPFEDRIEIKEKGITRLLLQNSNGLDLDQDELTLHEIIDSSIKYDIDILCLPETRTNWKNQRVRTTFNKIINNKRKELSTYNSESKNTVVITI